MPVIHVEVVFGPATPEFEAAINDRLMAVPMFMVPGGALAYPDDIEIEEAAGGLCAVISYECETGWGSTEAEQGDDVELAYVPRQEPETY